ncbi:unnamed protein product [Ilex paraguariensis]|uniref:Uncharacterized protein n=1 Tax=Ilex paraguariensis TaxID=185542 RepID=A0ABC8RCF4_9AQUA
MLRSWSGLGEDDLAVFLGFSGGFGLGVSVWGWLEGYVGLVWRWFKGFDGGRCEMVRRLWLVSLVVLLKLASGCHGVMGLLIFLGSTIGMAFVEGLFEHRVKTLSYGDGSSRLWEGPLLVVMYSFVVLIDSMMSAVFYFSCKNYSMEASKEESQPVLEAMTMPPGTPDIQ